MSLLLAPMRPSLTSRNAKCMIKLEVPTANHLMVKDSDRILMADLVQVQEEISMDFKARILTQMLIISSKAVFLVLAIHKAEWEEWEAFKIYLAIYLINEHLSLQHKPKRS